LPPGEALCASNSSELEEENIGEEYFVQGAVTLWSDAMYMKNFKQEENAMKAMKQCGKAA